MSRMAAIPACTLGYQPGAVGTMNMTGGAINTFSASIIVGLNGTGTFNQFGGTVNNSSWLYVGAFGGGGSGTYNLTNGSLNDSWAYVGSASSTGTFNQSGGNHTLPTATWRLPLPAAIPARITSREGR